MQDYVEKAIRTESIPEKIDVNIRLLHASLGIVTESIELLENKYSKDLVNYKEEIGDICWYIAILCNEFKVEFEFNYNIIKSEIESDILIEKLIHNAGALLNQVKRKIYYNKDFQVNSYIEILLNDIFLISASLNLNIEEILIGNIEKLKCRYPDKYNHDCAINRNIESELQALEL